MQQPDPTENHGTSQEDEPTPAASQDKVLEETARLAREGLKQLESDPKERKTGS
ncbi:hypothetical protein [Ramlibacter albus]|uniref:Uncharacterized protein n=1 Tax=Ramlibacter albus TaxID=2079448 RepID=A0A923MEE4_9BURK|nr:hypothetical protein [Ramlibacter albus]MBC5768586.1 hypothetical protein [Ramlibacter albus]